MNLQFNSVRRRKYQREVFRPREFPSVFSAVFTLVINRTASVGCISTDRLARDEDLLGFPTEMLRNVV